MVQYATVHSEDHAPKASTYNVYVQMRRTRKILRFLRTLEYTAQIRKDVPQLFKQESPAGVAVKLLTILENLCTVLFFLCDHRVFLGELEVISKDTVAVYYPRSMWAYLLQNVFGVLRNLAEIAVIFMEGKYQGKTLDMESGSKILKGKAVEIIRDILDIFVANYYINKPAGKAARIGVVGVITSIIGICQSLSLI